MLKKIDKNEPIKTPWPPICLTVSLSAGGSVAESLRVSPPKKTMTIDLSSQDVGCIAKMFGWSVVTEHTADDALDCMDTILAHAVDQAGMLSGYCYPIKQVGLHDWRSLNTQRPSALRASVRWPQCGQEEPIIFVSQLSLDLGSVLGGKMTGDQLMSEHRQRSQVFLATLIETFERLGCMPKNTSKGGLKKLETNTRSALPEKRSQASNGFAYAVELFNKDVVALRLSPHAASIWAQTSLWHAFGQYFGLSLLSSMAPIKSFTGKGACNISYASHALPGLKDFEFPCQFIGAKHPWRGVDAASAQQVREGLRDALGVSLDDLTLVRNVEGPHSIRSSTLEQWLHGVKAQWEAEDLAHNLKALSSQKTRGRTTGLKPKKQWGL